MNATFHKFSPTFVDDADDNGYEEDEITSTIKSVLKAINNKHEVENVLDTLFNNLLMKIDLTNHKSSGWTLKKINYFFVHFHKVKPSRGASYIPTPDKFNNSRCGLINIKNDDDECFKWCMKYHQSKREKNADRLSVLEKIEDKYNYVVLIFHRHMMISNSLKLIIKCQFLFILCQKMGKLLETF